MVGFYGISTIVSYLMPNPVYTYSSDNKLKNETKTIFRWFLREKIACTFMKFSQNILGTYMHLLHTKFCKFSFSVN